MDDLHKQLRAQAFAIEEQLAGLRHILHQHPEPGWSEFQTSQTIRSQLAQNGLAYTAETAGTGFYIDIRGEHTGPVIAYRADMDALPIHDRKEKPYASKRTGFGHLCGHDVHSTIAFGVTRLLHNHRHELHGTVRIFWQPAEEVTPSGAPMILKEGILDGIEAIYGVHCDPAQPSGCYSARPGAETGSFDTFEVTVDTPSTAHSARPYEGKDTIWIANQIIQHFYQMIGRVTDVRKPAVISVCTFHAGDALNVIPHHASFGGTLRAMNEPLRQQIREYMTDITREIGRINGVDARIRIGGGFPSVINNDQLYRFMRTLVSSQLGDEKFLEREQSIGAEDFAFYTERFPGLFLRVGTAHAQDTSFPLHHSRFDVDERILAPTSALMAYTLIRHLRDRILHSRPPLSSAEPLLSAQ